MFFHETETKIRSTGRVNLGNKIVNNSFTCPHCSIEAATFLHRMYLYLSFWKEIKCINCGKSLFPNLVTRKFTWFCFVIGFCLDLFFSWLLPWDKIFDFMFLIIIFIPLFLNFSLFSNKERNRVRLEWRWANANGVGPINGGAGLTKGRSVFSKGKRAWIGLISETA